LGVSYPTAWLIHHKLTQAMSQREDRYVRDEGHPLRAKRTPVEGFTPKAIEQWARASLAPGATVLSDGLACFGAVTAAGCVHRPVVVGERKPKDMPEFEWINTVLGNLKSSFSGRYHSFAFRKYAARYLAAFAYRLTRCFDLRTLQLACSSLRPTVDHSPCA